MDNVAILEEAEKLSRKELPVRFSSLSVALQLFVESFTTKPVLGFLGKKPTNFIPTASSDRDTLETIFRQRFPPHLLDPVLVDHPLGGVTNNDCYMLWLNENKPDGMAIEDFDLFVFLHTLICQRWANRRLMELQILRSIRLFSWGAATLSQIFLVWKAVESMSAGYWMLGGVQIVLMLIVMVLSGYLINTKPAWR